MIDLHDPVWATLKSGYQRVYNAAIPLSRMEQSQSVPNDIWDELWNELFHQNDIGIASYAAIPQLIRIYQDKNWIDGNLFQFAATIEKAKIENDRNPPVPGWLRNDYTSSLYQIAEYAMKHLHEKWDFYTLLGFLMLATLLQKQYDLAALLNLIDEGQASSIIEKL